MYSDISVVNNIDKGSTPVMHEMTRVLTAVREEMAANTASANRTSHMATERIKTTEETLEKVNHRLLESEATVAAANAQRMAIIHESDAKTDRLNRERAQQLQQLQQHLQDHEFREIEEEKAKVLIEAEQQMQQVLIEQQRIAEEAVTRAKQDFFYASTTAVGRYSAEDGPTATHRRKGNAGSDNAVPAGLG